MKTEEYIAELEEKVEELSDELARVKVTMEKLVACCSNGGNQKAVLTNKRPWNEIRTYKNKKGEEVKSHFKGRKWSDRPNYYLSYESCKSLFEKITEIGVAHLRRRPHETEIWTEFGAAPERDNLRTENFHNCRVYVY